MADVAIETSAHVALSFQSQRAGIFWTSPTVGYVIFADSNSDLKYRKTVDGGANWGAAVNIRTGTIMSYDCWADWQTAGDAGTKIHIAYIDNTSDDVRYVYLDTSGDSVGGDDQIEACQGSGSLHASVSRIRHYISITKTKGGNLTVALRYQDDLNAYFFSFYTSPDATTWTSENAPWEATNFDYILLFPGNEADNQDVWGTFWDTSALEISLKTYDDSGNSWGEQLISANMDGDFYYLQMDGQIRLSDGHLIFAAWSEYDEIGSDLMTWDINGAGSITAKTNVITNEAETFLVSVFVNQDNDDIYIAYVSGTAAGSTVKAFYQKSVDGGANWGGETAMQADAEDDEEWVSCGAVKAAWGGKFQPFWFNDDLDDLFTNVDNGISIAATGGVEHGPINTSIGLTADVSIDRAVTWDRGMSPGLTAAVTLVRVYGRFRAISTALAVSTTVSRAVAYARAVTSNLTASVTVARALAYNRAITTVLTVSTTIDVAKGWGKTVTSNLTASVTVARKVAYDRATALGLTVSITIARAVAYSRAVTAGLSIATIIVATLVAVTHYFVTVTTNLTVSVVIRYCAVLKKLLRVPISRLPISRLLISRSEIWRRIRSCFP